MVSHAKSPVRGASIVPSIRTCSSALGIAAMNCAKSLILDQSELDFIPGAKVLITQCGNVSTPSA